MTAIANFTHLCWAIRLECARAERGMTASGYIAWQREVEQAYVNRAEAEHYASLERMGVEF